MIRAAAAFTVLALVIAACTSGGSTTGDRPSSSSHPASTTPSTTLVLGRASAPTDVSAPGIQIPGGDSGFTVQVGSHEIAITGNNWDTIVATSRVMSDVEVEFASGFDWTATTRNRFQYLADLIARDEDSKDFDPLDIVTGITDKTATSIVALYNPGAHPGTLIGLHVKLISQPKETLVGSGDFFATADSSVFIASKTIIFTRLTYPVMAQPKPVNGTIETTTNFNYDSFTSA